MGRYPFAGQTWLYLNWLSALQAAGHEVWYVDDDTTWWYDPVLQSPSDDLTGAAEHVRRCVEPLGLGDRWALRFVDGETDPCWGLSGERIDDLYRDCDALLNICGAVDLREPQLAAPMRVYVQTDPVTAELRLANGDAHTREAFDNHHVIATYGENYGAPDCGVPLNGVRYVPTRQPIDLGLWPDTALPAAAPFTTIGNYRTPGSDVSYAGETYSWSKHHEWERFRDLPTRTGEAFSLALSFHHEADRDRVAAQGWGLVDPGPMTVDPFGAYRAFIQASRAEFTVAKDQNVRLRSGWFSERDACYLASGRPVVAQDTAFDCALPTGEGLFAIRTVEDACEAVERISAEPRRHARAARAIAEEFFDGRRVAEDLLQKVGLA